DIIDWPHAEARIQVGNAAKTAREWTPACCLKYAWNNKALFKQIVSGSRQTDERRRFAPIDLVHDTASCVIENLQPHGFGFTDHDRVDMLQGFFDPVGNMWAAGHDRHTERAISIRQGIGAAREARKERQGNKI